MAELTALKGFWKSFREKKIILRNVSILGFIMLSLKYQEIAVVFFVQEDSSSACNLTGRCLYTSWQLINGTRTKITQVTPYVQIDFETHGTVLVMTHFISLMFGALILGMLSDRYGRKRVLLLCLTVLFIASLLGATFMTQMSVFILIRIVADIALGGSVLVLYVLLGEYVNQGQRPLVLTVIWLASALSCISFPGIAFIMHNRRIIMVFVTLPLMLMLFLYTIIPESPRWVLLQSLPRSDPKSFQNEDDESQTLLSGFVGETQSIQQKAESCWCCDKKRCGFLRRKELRRIAVVLGLTWLAVGMLYHGLNTSSIQLLENFYSNYMLRELVNILGYACSVPFVLWAGRRITTFLGLMFSGAVCVIFSFVSEGFLLSEYQTVSLVVQLVGRFLWAVSQASLSLYSIELFPTVIRCTALGLVTPSSFLGIVLTTFIMDFQLINPIIPLAILGSFSIVVSVLLRVFLPETKGSLTVDTLEDTVVGRLQPYNAAWSPRVHMNRRIITEDNLDGDESFEVSCQMSRSIDINRNKDRYEDLGKSWELSFDKASVTSTWEWLSYEDARQRQLSLDVELSLQGESRLLDEQDRQKLSHKVPGSSWILLYSTYDHGISLKTFYQRMEEVESPVLLVIKDSQDYVFGVYSPIPPQIKPGFCSYGKSYFFTSKPHFKIFECSGKNAYYLNCDIDSLAFGCSDGLFGLWLDNDLHKGRSTACDTYSSEVLASSEDFIVLGLEAWTFA